jgi:hypothetical protein
MKTFNETIKAYLDQRAETDALFAEKYKNPKKSIEACCRYIVGEAHAQAKDGAAVLSDEVVYGMAVHYYDEEDIVIRKAPRTEVAKKLSAKDKERLRKEAENDYKAAELRKIENREYERRKKKTELRKQEESLFTGSLF